MSIFRQFLTITLLLLLPLSSFASSRVAKAIIVKGTVKAKEGKNITTVAKGQWLAEGALVQTGKRSFVKLVFIDKSTISIGPKSLMRVNKFPKKDAGIITLLKGQLRAKVTKDYMDIKDKDKSKLFIKTKTASMGVRGTDFQVNYNHKNRNTGLTTFEGIVAMGHIKKGDKTYRQSQLEKIVSKPSAVLVTAGKFAAFNPTVSKRVSRPVKVNKAQLSALEKNDGSIFKRTSYTSKQFKNIVPESVDAKDFVVSNEERDKQFGKKLDKATIAKIKGNTVNAISDFESNSHRNGGFIDTENVYYIPPPANAPIDPNTGLAILPAKMGGYDESTGKWTHPTHELTPSGDYKLKSGLKRMPASENERLTPPAVKPEKSGSYEYNGDRAPSANGVGTKKKMRKLRLPKPPRNERDRKPPKKHPHGPPPPPPV